MAFEIADPAGKYHVPVLLSPYAIPLTEGVETCPASSWASTSTVRPRTGWFASTTTIPGTRFTTSTYPPACEAISAPLTLTGDQSDVLPTDTQKQTAYAYAKQKGLASIEDYGLQLARHFVHDIAPAQAARIEIDEFAWRRVVVDGAEHDHTWIRSGQEVRTAAVTVDGDGEWVVGGLKDLVILTSTGSEFAGFLTDPYTVLEPTHDRVMATALVAQWRCTGPAGNWQVAWDEGLRGRQRPTGEAVCGGAVARPAADAVRNRQGRAGALYGHRGGAAIGTEQAPFRL